MKTPKILEYHVHQADTRLELIRKINNAIENGWQPLGGVAVETDGLRYYQAVVNYESESNAVA